MTSGYQVRLPVGRRVEGSATAKGIKGLFTRPVPSLLGMSFLMAWTQILYSSKILLLPPAQVLPLSITHLFSTIGVVATNLVLILLATRLTPIIRRRGLLYALGCVGAVATAGISLVSSGAVDAHWIILCVILTASAGCLLPLAWTEVYATQGIRGALVAYILSIIGGGVLCALAALLPQNMAILFVALLPLLAVVSLRPLNDPLLIAYNGRRPTLWGLIKDVPWQFIIVAGIISFALGAIRTNYLPDDPLASSTAQWMFSVALWVSTAVITSAVAFVAYRRGAALAFYIAIPFIALASLLLTMPLLTSQFFLLTATSMGVGLVNMLVWLLLIAAVINKRVPVLVSFTMLAAMQFAGTLLGQLTTVAVGANHMFISLAVLAVLLVAALVVISARGLLSPAKAPLATEMDPVLALGSQYGLSPRECEIADIWLAGHSSAYIEQTLHISKNTVKTHLSHIYQKTGVKNKEGLLALLDSIKAS
jgi:DNA-binding CsgD family transcriptional regulator